MKRKKMRTAKRSLACATCNQNCLLFHRTKQTSPTTFFKIITKQEYLTTLNVPPAFSSTVLPLVDKKIILNDSSEHVWEVKLSAVNDSFAFKEGWSSFSLDHGLEVGYLVVFNYIKDLHFNVKIYDLSACEKLDFSKKRNQKKRNRGRSGPLVRDGTLVRQGSISLDVSKHHVAKMKKQCCKVDVVVSQNGKESGQLMRASDPCILPIQEFDQSHGVNRTMEIVNRDLEVSNVDSYMFENDPIVCGKSTCELEGIFGMGAALDISEFEIYGRNMSLGEADKSSYDKTSTLKIEENKAIVFNGEAQECLFSKGLESNKAAISKKEPALHIGGFCNTKQTFNGFPNSLDAQVHNGEMKKLPVDMTPKLCGSVEKLNVKGLPKENKGELGHYSDTFNQHNESHFKTAPTLMSNGEAQECQLFKVSVSESDRATISKKESALDKGEIKESPVDMTLTLYCSMDKFNVTGEVPKTLKTELVTLDELETTGLPKEMKEVLISDISHQDNESHFKTAPPLSCEVSSDNVYLQLPKCLPLTCREKAYKQRRIVVLLRDQLGRLWPVFYHEKPQLKILAHGWLDFCRGNNIQPADECVFEADPESWSTSKRILDVRIVHK